MNELNCVCEWACPETGRNRSVWKCFHWLWNNVCGDVGLFAFSGLEYFEGEVQRLICKLQSNIIRVRARPTKMAFSFILTPFSQKFKLIIKFIKENIRTGFVVFGFYKDGKVHDE